jgi:hypothetical protein
MPTSEGFTNATALSFSDFQERGLSEAEARHRMNQLVFGHDYQTDAAGTPIETGKGSPSQQTPQHKAALARELERQLQMRPMRF